MPKTSTRGLVARQSRITEARTVARNKKVATISEHNNHLDAADISESLARGGFWNLHQCKVSKSQVLAVMNGSVEAVDIDFIKGGHVLDRDGSSRTPVRSGSITRELIDEARELRRQRLEEKLAGRGPVGRRGQWVDALCATLAGGSGERNLY